MSSLPFLTKPAFATAIERLTRHIDAYSSHLSYQVMTSTFDKEDVYIEITRMISSTTVVNPTADERDGFDVDIEDDEDDPEALLPSLSSMSSTHRVIYTITLSPIYSVPILHFTIAPLPPLPPTPVSLADVYELLVPTSRREELGRLGVQGGISQGEHPYTGRTVWFVHPCRTGDVLREFGKELKLEGYLGVWIGVFGGVVGLTL
ncbi:hypothetical protein TWF102_006682 [Orbilia oligospora]|uniref:Ubiquitin-like-conjugating enzyme ATG10 n=1 Tax=Orbilia oligospora TaxID=2813651 RepID=A0A7C8NT23_ORBOL|nr:hypothetical protein TWF706_008851 [Orbilia oligospora]KAF3096411.1 hypothetical protein TWF102_006682 [Orbilia oligospora]KAF3118309.1 hypothetical protein TWF103_000324 [Orbilia oligospora]KAF3140564.1 hypothetical protein TWF703_002769 [Orbilia oligospora]KAF3149295.1 hypothetical protein TWF594_011340 [Orbilia oligospora]